MTRLFRVILLIAFAAATSSHAQSDTAWLNLLRKSAFAELEAQTIAFQKRFEAGQETEFALRQAYRPFYDLTEQDWKNLAEWQKAYPKSYAVPLIRGTYYKRAGFNARGEKWASETSSKQFKEMEKWHALAVPELEKSLTLTEKPFLSVFHLLDLQGGREAKKALMDSGTKMLPTNRLIRARYMRDLTPRWGGSYPAMYEFLAYARTTGATAIGLSELEGIICDDIGDAALAEGDQNKAIRYFHKALELGAKAGGEVPQELKYSWYYRCKFPELAAYCR